jgi:hypothetical protein
MSGLTICELGVGGASPSCSTCNGVSTCDEPYSPGIVLAGRPADNSIVRGWLDRLRGLATGRELLAEIDRHGAQSGPCRLERGSLLDGFRIFYTSVEEAALLGARELLLHTTPPGIAAGRAGRLDRCRISWNHEARLNGRPVVGPQDPGAALIGHELIHALHVVDGTFLANFDDSRNGGDPRNMEETRTTGIREFTQTYFTENRLRHELGVPTRVEYATLGGGR